MPTWSTIRPIRSVRRAAAAQPAGDGLADAEHVADLDRDAVGRGDARELDEVHDGLLGQPAHQVGEPGLPETAGSDDRGDP